jgi:hypothetical protein
VRHYPNPDDVDKWNVERRLRGAPDLTREMVEDGNRSAAAGRARDVAAGPPEATLNATYDAEQNRVALHITPAPNTTYVTVQRDELDGSTRPVERLAYVTVDGPSTFYDYAAPLNQPADYSVIFFRREGERLFVDFTRETTITPTWDGGA